MSVYRKSNMPTSVVRALTGRIEDVIMGYPLDSAKAALAAVTLLIEAQEAPAEVIVPLLAAALVGTDDKMFVEGPNA
jgi:hypothetical protein